MAPRPGQNISLTIIVAATAKELGIGNAGSLPWRIKQEMQYFARVTKRVPLDSSTHIKPDSTRCNAVIMGRKTWDSIPPKFRPLKDRLNVVLSRNSEFTNAQPATSTSLAQVRSELPTDEDATRRTATNPIRLGRVFVIGGASVYHTALQLPQTKHILLTKVHKEFDCDTHFPLNLGSREAIESGWLQKSKGELESFIGEDLPDVLEEEGVKFEYCLYERG
ncbi:hypothetical protein P152DRAFT_396975 [Eremomyces bilateralis CBS 781.70]|uniref:Dihydrofolate reductase n=1 Tax=Eremomyces bilateralis CBS 781.70 TaxID=1392243 RepID=A0A6G1G3V4_9PEZI|nr:uncharacterized protein P152DRAFT_396975 [Eremomyces bilateralis CBS 781.70]KAF1812662.1 hypothetical protein P152DRAFT_396975 [Eremomyces bilateralis CBS 781.70]